MGNDRSRVAGERSDTPTLLEFFGNEATVFFPILDSVHSDNWTVPSGTEETGFHDRLRG